MTNLLGNAIKFTPAGQILLTADVAVRYEHSVDVSIAAQDSGVGLTEEVVARLFDPFTQEDESVTRPFGGTGLGLTICRELVYPMKGRIEVRSKRFEGTTFTVHLTLPLVRPLKIDPSLRSRRAVIISRLPGFAEGLQGCCRLLRLKPSRISPDRPGEAATRLILEPPAVVIIDLDSSHDWVAGWNATDIAASGSRTVQTRFPDTLARLDPTGSILSHPISPYPLHQLLLTRSDAPAATYDSTHAARVDLRGHVLVAEDNEVNAAVVEGFLKALGCSCRIVVTGREAAQIVHSERFYAILMDVHMPDIDGLAATRMIREPAGDVSRIPIITLTANSGDAQRRECLDTGMNYFLSKPAPMTELQEVLSHLLLAPVAQPPEPKAWRRSHSWRGCARTGARMRKASCSRGPCRRAR